MNIQQTKINDEVIYQVKSISDFIGFSQPQVLLTKLRSYAVNYIDCTEFGRSKKGIKRADLLAYGSLIKLHNGQAKNLEIILDYAAKNEQMNELKSFKNELVQKAITHSGTHANEMNSFKNELPENEISEVNELAAQLMVEMNEIEISTNEFAPRSSFPNEFGAAAKKEVIQIVNELGQRKMSRSSNELAEEVTNKEIEEPKTMDKIKVPEPSVKPSGKRNMDEWARMQKQSNSVEKESIEVIKNTPNPIPEPDNFLDKYFGWIVDIFESKVIVFVMALVLIYHQATHFAMVECNCKTLQIDSFLIGLGYELLLVFIALQKTPNFGHLEGVVQREDARKSHLFWKWFFIFSLLAISIIVNSIYEGWITDKNIRNITMSLLLPISIFASLHLFITYRTNKENSSPTA